MRKPRLSHDNCIKLMNGLDVNTGKYAYYVQSEWNSELSAYEDVLYRQSLKDFKKLDRFPLKWEGIWEYCIERA